MNTTHHKSIKPSNLIALAVLGLGSILGMNIAHAVENAVENVQGLEAKKADPSAKEKVDIVAPENQVPFLSTYYLPPKVEAGQETSIDYYVTDFDQKEYRKDDQIIAFTVDYWVNGTKTTLPKIKAGDNTITIPSLPKGEVLFAMQATDSQGRKSHRIYQRFLVIDPTDSIIPDDKILQPDLKKFDISNDDTHPVETTKGLSEMLKWASDHSYRKVVLPNGIYRLDENSTVQMATNLTLDMNGSTFKLNPNANDKGLMLEFINCSDSHVVNGSFEGDLSQQDFEKAANQSARIDAISISQGSEYCTIEKIYVRNITGRGVITNSGVLTAEPKEVSLFTSGDLDEKGQKLSSESRVTMEGYLDISDNMKSFGFIQLGGSLKDQGNSIGNWVYRAHFFDASKKYLETIDGYLYRRLYPPKDASFVKFTLFSTAKPETLFVFNVQSPYNCSLISINPQNIRSAGMALNGYENLLVENCSFANCGKELAKSAFYAADGLDLMQDLTFRNNKFPTNPHTEVTVKAGHNTVIEGDVGKIDISERAHSFVLRNNNKITSLRAAAGPKIISGYCRVQNNRFRETFSIINATEGEKNWKLVLKQCHIGGHGDGPGAVLLNSLIGNPTLTNCEIAGGTLSPGNYTNYYIHDMYGNNRGGIYQNCRFERISGKVSGIFDADSCIISDWDCGVSSNETAIMIKNSVLNNFLIHFGFWLKGANTLIENCKINNWDYLLHLPYYSLKKPITLSNITFTTCGNKGMVFFYHDVVGKSAGPAVEQEPLTIKNNTLDLGDSDYVVTGPDEGTKQIIKLVFENNTVHPKSVLPVNPEARKSKNVTIVEK